MTPLQAHLCFGVSVNLLLFISVSSNPPLIPVICNSLALLEHANQIEAETSIPSDTLHPEIECARLHGEETDDQRNSWTHAKRESTQIRETADRIATFGGQQHVEASRLQNSSERGLVGAYVRALQRER